MHVTFDLSEIEETMPACADNRCKCNLQNLLCITSIYFAFVGAQISQGYIPATLPFARKCIGELTL